MRTLLFFFFLLLYGGSDVFGQSAARFVLVRHAEKESGGEDPHLSEEGKMRAIRLADMLDSISFQRVYSTDYNRTRETVAPLAERKNIQISIYDPRDNNFIPNVLNEFMSKEEVCILISGHSNTIPSIINFLTGGNYKNFDDNDYGNLVIIDVPQRGKPDVLWLRY